MRHDKKKPYNKKKSNTDRLSQGKKIAQQKAKWKAMRTEECTFNPTERAEFLTGFHKRKMERRNIALAKTQKEQREQKLQMRQDLREQRRRELEQRVQAYRANLGLDPDGEIEDDALLRDEWYGFSDDEESAARQGATQGEKKNRSRTGLWEVNEYEDDEKTVSVQIEEL